LTICKGCIVTFNSHEIYVIFCTTA